MRSYSELVAEAASLRIRLRNSRAAAIAAELEGRKGDVRMELFSKLMELEEAIETKRKEVKII